MYVKGGTPLPPTRGNAHRNWTYLQLVHELPSMFAEKLSEIPWNVRLNTLFNSNVSFLKPLLFIGLPIKRTRH